MARTIAMQAGGVILLLGLLLGAFGSQPSMLLLLVGSSVTLLMLWTVITPRHEPLPVRVRRDIGRR
jgi:hypothetical protein